MRSILTLALLSIPFSQGLAQNNYRLITPQGTLSTDPGDFDVIIAPKEIKPPEGAPAHLSEMLADMTPSIESIIQEQPATNATNVQREDLLLSKSRRIHDLLRPLRGAYVTFDITINDVNRRSPVDQEAPQRYLISGTLDWKAAYDSTLRVRRLVQYAHNQYHARFRNIQQTIETERERSDAIRDARHTLDERLAEIRTAEEKRVPPHFVHFITTDADAIKLRRGEHVTLSGVIQRAGLFIQRSSSNLNRAPTIKRSDFERIRREAFDRTTESGNLESSFEYERGKDALKAARVKIVIPDDDRPTSEDRAQFEFVVYSNALLE